MKQITQSRTVIFTEVMIKVEVFCVTPCSAVVGYQCFGGPFCLTRRWRWK